MNSILGIKVNPLTYSLFLQTIGEVIKDKKKGYVCVAAVHLIIECQHNDKLFAGVNNSLLTTPDGVPLVWILRLLGNKTDRVYGPTLMKKVLKEGQQRDWSVFILGGASGQSNQITRKIKAQYPQIKIAGFLDTPQRATTSLERKKIRQQINQAKPDIVIAGMGCPYQEKWMMEEIDQLNTHVLIGVGAAFDFYTNKVRQAPSWVQQLGLEWFFRLLQEPKRLWKRYLLKNTEFIIRLITQKVINPPKKGRNNK